MDAYVQRCRDKSPPALKLHTSSDTPNAMQGYDAPSPGSALSSCRMLLLFVCLTAWQAGRLTEGTNERVWGLFLCYSQEPRAPLINPQHAASSSFQHPTPWLCGCLATANGMLVESSCRVACGLDNGRLSNEDDGNVLPSSSLLPLKCCLNTELILMHWMHWLIKTDQHYFNLFLWSCNFK